VEPSLQSTPGWDSRAGSAESDGREDAYRAGGEGPKVESKAGGDGDGVEVRLLLDYGAGFVDGRGWYANAGA